MDELDQLEIGQFFDYLAEYVNQESKNNNSNGKSSGISRKATQDDINNF